MITSITFYEVAATLRPEELWEIMVRINRLGEVDGWYSIDSNQVQSDEVLHHYLAELDARDDIKSLALYKFIVAVLEQINGYDFDWWDNFTVPKDKSIAIRVREHEVEMRLRIIQKLKNKQLSTGNRIYEFRLDLNSRLKGAKQEIFGDNDIILRGIFQLGQEMVEIDGKYSYDKYVVGVFDKAYSNPSFTPSSYSGQRNVDKTDIMALSLDGSVEIQDMIEQLERDDTDE